MYHVEKNQAGSEDIVINGFEQGIAPSPHKGIGDLKNVNITSLNGEAAVNYERVQQLPVVVNGTMNASSSTHLKWTGTPLLVPGSVIVFNQTGFTLTGINYNIRYWVNAIVSNVPGDQIIDIAAAYGGAVISGMGTTGTGVFNTYNPAKLVQGCTEYVSGQGAFRYYMVDVNGEVWADDVNIYANFSPAGYYNSGSPLFPNADVSGIAVTQGCVFVFCENTVYFDYTDALGQGGLAETTSTLQTPIGNQINSHYAITAPYANSPVYFCDASTVQSIVPVQSFSELFCIVVSSSTITIGSYKQGVIPMNGLAVHPFAPIGGSVPSEITGQAIYYIIDYNEAAATFSLSATKGGSAVNSINGTFYISTFYPFIDDSNTWGTAVTATLPSYEATTCLTWCYQSGVTLAAGTVGTTVYFISIANGLVSTILNLPEANTHRLLNVDNTIYIFPGHKGNIYLTNGVNIAGVISVPDYCANVFGANQDPAFTWGDVMFLRGRVWFSIQDQTSSITGNCGGIWSFAPTQNLFLGQDQGTSLRLENQSSYATYNGLCTVLIASFLQNVQGAQYFSGWWSDITGTTYGIDYSGTVPYNGTQYSQIDSDLIAVGDYLRLYTPSNIQYKTSRPLVSGESVEMFWRPDLTSTFTSLGTDTTVGDTAFEFPANLQNLQWLQLRVRGFSTTSSPSFVPFTEFRIRP